jgi:serine/threonine-protein kinase
MPLFCIHCRAEIDSKYKACPFCGEPITEFLRRYLDTPIDGKYQILSRLGVGGMGEVYKVLHIHLNAIRVIKLMRAKIVNDPGSHDRFLREGRLATRLQHPNVAALFDFSTLDDGSMYMVWEYIEGINLQELIGARGPLSPRYAARLAVQTLQGLDAIHRAGIVHRDISPENLMIAREPDGGETVKIIDLGIAKQWSEEQDTKTKTGMFVGKWKYCSPEHLGLLKPGQRIDGRADLYSFGIVLYEMLTGVPPFVADTPADYLMMHTTERPRSLRDVNPTVRTVPELEAVIFRALKKDRQARFKTAREFADAIERLIPLLDDTPASSTGPAMAEVTAQATRVGSDDDAEPSAPDVDPMEVDPVANRVLTHGGDAAIIPIAQARRRRMLPAFLVMALLIAVALGVSWMWRPRAEVRAHRGAAGRVQSSIAGVTPGHLGINAYPWAMVTSIRDVRSGRSVALEKPLVTPAPIDLAPGRYEVTLSNPDFPEPIVKTVEVKAGEEQMLHVPFADASKLALPPLAGTVQ